VLVVLVGWASPGFAQQRFYTISTVAGVYPIVDGGPATSTLLYSPFGVAVASAGDLYIADTDNNRVRRVTPEGVITTVVGDGAAGFRGDGGPAASARLNQPRDVAVDSAGNLYIADRFNDRIRRVTPSGIISTVAGGGGAQGFGGDGGPATRARLNRPENVAVDPAGSLYIADTGNHRIRKVGPDGVITTVAGTGTPGFNGDGVPGPQAQLNAPSDVAVDTFGNLYIADRNNHRVRRVTPAGTVSTYAGNGTAGSAGDNGPATLAQLRFPGGVAVDEAGNLYVPVVGSIRKVSPAGIITTIAGTATEGFSGDGGPALAAQFDNPVDGAVDAAGNLYLADQRNHRVRKISASGVVSTVAGTFHFGGDGGPATAALLFAPRQLAIDSAGNL
jgi:sugar lactone lactonase YvrE